MYLDSIPSSRISLRSITPKTIPQATTAIAFSVVSDLEKTLASIQNFELEAVLAKFANRPKDKPILHAAVQAHDKDSVLILLKNGFDLELRAPTQKVYVSYGVHHWIPGDTPLGAAYRNNDLEMIQFLLEHGANPNNMRSTHHGNPKKPIYDYSLIYEAIWKVTNSASMRDQPGKAYGLNVLKLIIASGADLNQFCIYGEEGWPPMKMTPLQFIQYRIHNLSGGWVTQEEVQSYYEIEKVFLEASTVKTS